MLTIHVFHHHHYLSNEHTEPEDPAVQQSDQSAPYTPSSDSQVYNVHIQSSLLHNQPDPCKPKSSNTQYASTITPPDSEDKTDSDMMVCKEYYYQKDNNHGHPPNYTPLSFDNSNAERPINSAEE